MPDDRDRQYKEVYNWLAQNGIRPLEPELAIYRNPEVVEQDAGMMLAVSVDMAAVKGLTLPAAAMAVRELPGIKTIASTILKGDIWDVERPIAALCMRSGANGRWTNKIYTTS